MYSFLNSRIHWSFSSNSGSVSKSHTMLFSLSSTGRKLVPAYLIERDVTVGGVLAGHTEHAFADDVARHLGAAATEAAPLAAEELVGVVVDDRADGAGGEGGPGDLQVDIGLAHALLAAEQPDDGARRAGERARPHPPPDPLGELGVDDFEDVRLGHQLADVGVAAHTRLRREPPVAGQPPAAAALQPAAAHVGGAPAHRVALVEQQARRHGPAVVDRPHHVGRGDVHVVEELLAELARPAD